MKRVGNGVISTEICSGHTYFAPKVYRNRLVTEQQQYRIVTFYFRLVVHHQRELVSDEIVGQQVRTVPFEVVMSLVERHEMLCADDHGVSWNTAGG